MWRCFYQLTLEICGDGLNLGSVECDDGNNNDGDGCSSICNVESGYRCTKEKERPDICKDVLRPHASANVKKGNQIVIMFNEPVLSLVASINLLWV